ncbi:hypothetical protein HDU87_002965 [Geranomyces variabilis]|uniref:Cyclic nucleotide-binding domain-containing protein n=1 Tax=Geranomyces variabilis TaxID=109894 RepID=A0AAD5XNI3_9FUNG|nr:hypothetical protein HDU87_002965 [Geranomyces variabilis]
MASASVSGTREAAWAALDLPENDVEALLAKAAAQKETIAKLTRRWESSENDRAKLVSSNKILREHLALVCQLQEQLQGSLKAYEEITSRVHEHLALTQQLQTLADPSSGSLTDEGITPPVAEFGTRGPSSGALGDSLLSGGGGGAGEPSLVISAVPPALAPLRSPVTPRASRGTPSMMRRASVAAARSPVQSTGSVISLLKMFPLFAEFPPDVLFRLAKNTYEMYRSNGQVIISKGERGAEMFFLETGDVTVMAAGADGLEDVPLAKLSDKSFFGELGVLFDQVRTANVQAANDCHLIVITKQKIQDALQPYPELQERLVLFAQDRERWWNTKEYKVGFGMEFIANIARQDIQKLPIFTAASDEFLENLSNRVTSVVFAPNATIIARGDDSDSIFFIIRGSAQVLGGAPGESVVHAELAPGTFFGELGVILNIKRTADIRAKEECYCLKLTRESLSEVQEAYPEMKQRIQEVVDERFKLYNDRMKGPADKRVGQEQFHLEVSKQQLAKLPIFRGIDDQIVGELSMLMEQALWKSGQTIIQSGQRADSMFFLASGEVDVLSEFGEQIDKARGPDAWFGEVALLQDVPRTATVRARTECSTFALKKDDFMASLKKNPSIAERIEETARERLQAYLMRSILA